MAKRIISAIDIGSTKIVAVIASIEGNTNPPQVLGVAVQPSAGLKKGVLINIDSAIASIATTLEAAERMAGITTNSVYININGKHITSTNNKGVVATSSQDEIMVNDVFRAIESARTISIPPSREIIHVIPREFIIDTQNGIKDPVGMSGSRLEVDAHIISGVSTSIQNVTKCVQSLGLRIDDLLFSGWASAISCLTETEKQLGVLLLDIGGGTTSICSFVEDSITFSGCIEYGGINVTSDLAICFRTTLEAAEKLKINLPILFHKKKPAVTTYAGNNDIIKRAVDNDADLIDISLLGIPDMLKVSQKMIEKIIEARMTEIFEMCKEQIEQIGYTTHLPAGIVITGGSALLPGVTDIARTVFGVQARIGYPQGLSGMVEEVSSPQFASVCGMILHASSTNRFDVNALKTGITLRGSGTQKDNSKPSMMSKFKKMLGSFGN